MDLTKIVDAGKALGLDGVELREFVEKREEAAREREERALEREERNREREEKERNRDKEERERREAYLIEMRRLEIQLEQEKNRARPGGRVLPNPESRVKASKPKLPPFHDRTDDLDAYLKRFERYATSQEWKESEWPVNLSALLTGKALEVYYRLSSAEANDYKLLKLALLKRFQLTADGFRHKLRTAKPKHGESGLQFAARLSNYLDRWIDLAEGEKTFQGLKDLLLREQFTDGCGKDLALFLRERQPKTIQAMAEIAEQYLEARGGLFGKPIEFKQKEPNSPQLSSNNVPSTSSAQSPSSFRSPTCFICHRVGHLARNCRVSTMYKPNSPPKCYRCLKTGHIARNCRQDANSCAGLSTSPQKESDCQKCTKQHECKAKKEIPDVGASMVTKMSESLNQCCINDDGDRVTLQCGHCLPIMTAALNNSISKMPVYTGCVGSRCVSVLRDSGCSGVVVKKDLVSAEQLTGKEKTCVLIDGTVRNLPVALIQVNTPFFSGNTYALCMNNPIYDLILGNIAGVRAPGNPDPTWAERNLEGCSVVTRSQANNMDKPFRTLKTTEIHQQIITAVTMKTAQQQDVSLAKFKDLAEKQTTTVSNKQATSRFIYHKDLLYRQFSSPNIEHGDKFTQLVVPADYRRQVMRQAHETLLGGHQGVKKTTDKVLTTFWWPGVTADITRYCRSCDICQRTVQKGRVTKVPLGSMPLIEVPFERIAVDIVGPIFPMSKGRNRYIITIIDFATRYPEAVPLPSIEAERVAEALVGVFSRLGIPKEMLTDRGSQFTSEVMKQVSKLLSIRQVMTSPYHPACNGLVERFNGTLKQMLKRMCAERPTDWDRYIDPLLFAVRESSQESLGFSPFELLYGRTVRGPMSILRELWTEEIETPETKTTYQYVMDLQERLHETCQMAQKNLQKSKVRYKQYYDKKSKSREFEVGDKVLLLLPTDKNKLLLQWKGPFKVVKKCGYLDYQIDINGKFKIFHANLLKRYYERTADISAALEVSEPSGILELASTAVIECEPNETFTSNQNYHLSNENLLQLHPLLAKETTADIRINESLDDTLKHEVHRLIGNYKDVLTDLPGKTTLGQHEIKLETEDIIRSKPYPLPHALRGTIKDEVNMMLNLGVVEPSGAPFASPIVLVKKPDGSNRFCVDFRKLNQVTVFDAEPISDQEELFTRLAHDHYFTKIDLSKGYWQVPMDEASKPLTSFLTPDGLFQFNVMPFGLVNAPATFSRIMRKLLKGMDNTLNYIDDILIHTASWDQHMKCLSELFGRLRRANLTARPSKCFIGYETIEFLGHVVGKGQVKPRVEKVQSILSAKQPERKKQLRSFLGMTNYYRKFIPNYSVIACPLTDKTKNREPNRICWEKAQESAFVKLKGKLNSTPILCLPNLNKDFILRTDASECGVGAVLMQQYGDVKFPVAYASKKLLPREKAYSVMEKECLAIVWSVRKFESYLYGRNFTLETDHQPLVFMQRAKLSNGRIMRWALALQPYKFRIEAIKGSENVGADYLSRVKLLFEASGAEC
ncbi:uncharacterized protein [Antedon mediterranea]|uniref:uncharacterized protein n=1 Tax=Antedon mediterranea TaxID=105859 RepID=UPI003AF54B27